MDDPLWNAEAINDAVIDEFDYVMRFDFSKMDALCQLGKVIGYCKDELMSFG